MACLPNSQDMPDHCGIQELFGNDDLGSTKTRYAQSNDDIKLVEELLITQMQLRLSMRICLRSSRTTVANTL